MSEQERVKFGAFEFDPQTAELWRGSERVSLPPKPAKVLALLLASPGELIARETFREQLWGADTYVDFEHGLNFCVRRIRAALGDDARHPQFIETLPKRGYRFVARKQKVPAAPEPPPAGESALVAANECYVRARRAFAQLGKDSLAEAALEFQRAIELQPDYAMAHSGLGATLSLRMLNRRDPAELVVALRHLERAIELDAELTEPYPWLCFARLREGRTDLALVAGERGVHLQPDSAPANYFLGLAHFATAEEGQDEAYPAAVRSLSVAARVGPYWHPTWFVLSYTALLNGDYARAEGYAGKLLESYGKPGNPFVGGELVIGSARLRQGDTEGAREVLAEFLRRMMTTGHMYRDAMTAIADCVLGEVELRQGNHEAALAAFRRSWQSLQEHTRIAAHARVSARAQTGLAHAYLALDQKERGAALLERAVALTKECTSVASAAAGANFPELLLSLAAAQERAGNRMEALALVERATLSGWRDAAWLESDSMLTGLRTEPAFQRSVQRARRKPDLPWGV